jgi:hypothetical protein
LAVEGGIIAMVMSLYCAGFGFGRCWLCLNQHFRKAVQVIQET